LKAIFDDERGQVTDFGDFVEIPKIKGLLKYYVLNPAHLNNYTRSIRDFINLTERWLNATNDEFLIDNVKMFELHFPRE